MTKIQQNSSIDYAHEITIFTDGSALSNSKTSAAGWGVYIPALKRSFSKGFIGTNNHAELEAIRVALWYFNERYDDTFANILNTINKHEIYIISDSEYSINAVTGVNKVKANKNIIDTCKKLISDIEQNRSVKIYFIHVNSHTNGNDFMSVNNAIVDKLARTAAENVNKSSTK